jgi:hypothetical protein
MNIVARIGRSPLQPARGYDVLIFVTLQETLLGLAPCSVREGTPATG